MFDATSISINSALMSSSGSAKLRYEKCLQVWGNASWNQENEPILYGRPPLFCMYYGQEFTSRLFMAWAQMRSILHILIQLGRPMQDSYNERFSGKLRDEQLNVSWFETLQQAMDTASIWKQD